MTRPNLLCFDWIANDMIISLAHLRRVEIQYVGLFCSFVAFFFQFMLRELYVDIISAVEKKLSEQNVNMATRKIESV